MKTWVLHPIATNIKYYIPATIIWDRAKWLRHNAKLCSPLFSTHFHTFYRDSQIHVRSFRYEVWCVHEQIICFEILPLEIAHSKHEYKIWKFTSKGSFTYSDCESDCESDMANIVSAIAKMALIPIFTIAIAMTWDIAIAFAIAIAVCERALNCLKLLDMVDSLNVEFNHWFYCTLQLYGTYGVTIK